MTKDQYYEMCEMLGTEPIEEEVPIDFSDLADEVQEAMLVYNMLQDNWEGMSGVYMGKVVAGISDIFKIMNIEDERTVYTIISILDRERSEILNAKHKNKAAK